MSEAEPRTPGGDHDGGLPERPVSVNELVAYNMKFFRKAAGLTQEQLGERLGGWSGPSVSAAERSWDGRRVRKFDADEIVSIALALGVPVIALLLPPTDAGTQRWYRLRTEPGQPDVTGLLSQLAPTSDASSDTLTAFGRRLLALGASGIMGPAVETQAADLLAEARRNAERITSEAHRQAELITSEALVHAPAGGRDADTQENLDPAVSEVVADARREADETLGLARREADELLAKARLQSEKITGDARARAVELDEDVQEAYSKFMGSLPQMRDELERRVNDLRSFEREYRSRLLAYLEGQAAYLKDVFPELSASSPPAVEERSE